ncbi:7312_t:CDS:2, partial [Acaulospora morrowiae]
YFLKTLSRLVPHIQTQTRSNFCGLEIRDKITLHTTSLRFNNNEKSRPSEYSEKPPVSDTIVPTPMASAFRNMFDNSSIRSWTMLHRVTNNGFITSDNVHIRGPVVLLNGELFLWDVPQGVGNSGGVFGGWKEDFLKIFEVIIPRPELLIFGTGKTFIPIPLEVRNYIYKLGLQIDVLDTDNALATFNVLAEEGRDVAAVFLPIRPTNART